MRLAISNIAWDVAEDEHVARLLQGYDIDAIDIAPGKYFPDPANARREDLARVKTWWTERNIEITGMQALLFGTTGLNVFGSKECQDAMLAHLTAVCKIGAGLGATHLVFGSPKNRDRSGLTDQQTVDMALGFFTRLGDIAASHGVLFCLEPNPPCYGANFMTTSAETAKIVERLAHPAIRMQLDTGAFAINSENVSEILANFGHLIGHVHASEPDLLPLGDSGARYGHVEHGDVYAALKQYLPSSLISIEMLATQHEPHIAAIERALKVAIRNYRPATGDA